MKKTSAHIAIDAMIDALTKSDIVPLLEELRDMVPYNPGVGDQAWAANNVHSARKEVLASLIDLSYKQTRLREVLKQR